MVLSVVPPRMIALFTAQELRLGLVGCPRLHEPVASPAMLTFLACSIGKGERLRLIPVDDLKLLFFLRRFFEFWRFQRRGFIAARGANEDSLSFLALWQQQTFAFWTEHIISPFLHDSYDVQ